MENTGDSTTRGEPAPAAHGPSAQLDSAELQPPRPGDAVQPMLAPDFAQRSKTRTRGVRRGVSATLLAVIVAAVAWLKVGGHNPLPVGVPLIGKDAGDIYNEIHDAGWPVAPGQPKSNRFADLVKHNSCSSSKAFVRTDRDVGWAIICVKPPHQAYERLSSAFNNVPMFMGPLYVDDGDGNVVIFGFGWPADTSKKFYDAIGASGGNYLASK